MAWIPFLFGLLLTTFLVLSSYRAPRNVDFITSSIIAGTFFHLHLVSYFDGSMELFVLLCSVVSILGAGMGGVIGMLLPKIATGVSLGFLISIFFGVAIYGIFQNSFGDLLTFAMFLTIIGSSVFLTQKKEELCSFLRMALSTGLVFSVSIDFLWNGALLSIISRVLRMKSPDSNMCYSQCHVPLLLTLWILFSTILFIVQAVYSGALKRWFALPTHLFSQIPQLNPDAKLIAGQQKTFSYPDALEFNYFDPDNLPELLHPYAEIVFSNVQTLAKMYGFQVDNSRNQAEHCLMMLSNEQTEYDSLLSDPPRRLHSKIFANYIKWCDRMGVRPMFVNRTSGKVYASTIEDILMFLLVWGEAANLKHMPECLCYLYHKIMEDHINNIRNKLSPAVYPGFFLDMVITPMYDVVSASLRNHGEHFDKKNYDDFNEFFWSPFCLRYNIRDTSNDVIESLHLRGSQESVHVANAMKAASKTYVEKRSWLHPLLSMHRIFEWHIVTFSILTVWAFSNQLVWNYTFTLHCGSFIFWEITFMSIIWTCLEVWALYPNAKISGPSICGYLIRLLAGYLVLIYQTIYFHWSFRPDSTATTSHPFSSSGLRSHGNPNFWWWQYIWLSLMSTSLYFLQSIMCWFPSIVSSLMTWNNEIVQAILNICYPTSQLYVGKKIDVPQKEVFLYVLYWVTLIAFKLWFGYRFIVNPVTIPSLEMYDDYMNFDSVSFLKTSTLMFVWWFPHFMVYLIDLSIWYSMWSSLAGGFVALVDRQGAVRNSRLLRSHFMRLPLAFCQKVMPFTVKGGSLRSKINNSISTVSLTNLTLLPKKDTHEKQPEKPNSNFNRKGPARAMSSADLGSYQLNSPSITATTSKGATTDTSIADSVTQFLEPRSQRWIIFGRVWNEVIQKLRETDHLNNTEKENLLFSSFNYLTKPVYLPLFQTAGCVETTIYAYKEAAVEFYKEVEPQKRMLILERLQESIDVTSQEATGEAWELTSWIFRKLLGNIHLTDVLAITNVLEAWSESHQTDELFSNLNLENITGIMNHIGNIVGMLKGCISKRKKSPIVTPAILSAAQQKSKEVTQVITGNSSNTSTSLNKSNSMKRSVSTGFLSSINTDDLDIHAAEGSSIDRTSSVKSSTIKFAKLQPFRQAEALVDNVRDKIREELRNLLNTFRNALRMKGGISEAGHDAITRLTFVLSVESGFLWNDVYASLQLDEFARDSNTQQAVNKLNGLLKLRVTQVDVASPEAQRRLHFFVNSLFMDMPSVPSTRYCKEYTCMTPFYSEDVLLTRDDLESKNSDGVSTILYLQTLYKKDWINFLERRGMTDDQLMWSSKQIQETRIWASLRAQTLFRTVEGMMYSEAAIRLLSELEQVSMAETETFAKLKFNYVVACQVYGQMRKNMEHKADDIDFLLARHPNLRVAYIDNTRVNRDGDLAFYSVLIKYDHNISRVKEVYRIKLPGNPVLGEGKPENQNHAIVFSRGRYLQAIDMNQDGYFEESLKMRNLLQEFESGCSILGFREHIFTGSVSSVANYMALQELSFVTLGQRVLCNPLRIRQHYGHPDLFDKMFVMTEGGMSKASKGINLSEDVFAGFNATIRGHSIGFKEYAQVGKGRDVGLQQTYKFEAKLSQGNAEQSLSRDMYRICDRLDFFRLMSFYYGGIGHYMSNTMVMFTLVLVVYTMLSLAVYGQEGVNGRPMHPEGVLQLLLSGLGLLQTLPLAITLTVEKGFFAMIGEISFMMLSGGPLYFIFHIQTKCYYFQQTLMAGGAMYRPTGRGFVIRHSPFDENYRFFASSHIYLGFELMIALILFAIYTTSKQYSGLTWSLWLTVVSFLMGPFWFNPVTFEWNKVKEDYILWINWMTETGGVSEQSWEAWWREENNFFKSLSLSWKAFLFIQKCCIWVFVACGLMGLRFLHDTGEQQRVVEVLALFALFGLGNWLISKLERSFTYAVRRFASLTLSVSVGCITIYMFLTHTLYIRYTVAIYYLVSACSFLMLMSGFTSISYVYKLHDYLVGHTIFFFLAVFSTFQLGYLQTWLLYHNALSSGVVIDDILKHARKTKEEARDEINVVLELREKLQEQEKMIKLLQNSFSHHSDEKTSLLSNSSISDRYGSNDKTNVVNVGVGESINKGAVDGAMGNMFVAQSNNRTPSPLKIPLSTTASQKSAVAASLSPPIVSLLSPAASNFPVTVAINPRNNQPSANETKTSSTSNNRKGADKKNNSTSVSVPDNKNSFTNNTSIPPTVTNLSSPSSSSPSGNLFSGSAGSLGASITPKSNNSSWNSLSGKDAPDAPTTAGEFIFSQPTKLPPK